MLIYFDDPEYYIDKALFSLVANEAEIVEGVQNLCVNLKVCDNKTIQEYNAKYRGIDAATDVLSFPLESFGTNEIPLGSIIINTQKAQEVSQNLGHSLDSEIVLLFIHGLLHLLGFDHERDSGEHRAKEQEIAMAFGLPETLIVRNT